MKRIIQEILKRLGLQVLRYPGYLDQDRIRQLIIKHFSINCVIDGGANEGQYGKLLRLFRYNGSINSFEPVPSIYATLAQNIKNDPLWKAYCLGLGNKIEQVKINVAGKMSSILPVSKKNDSIEFNVAGNEVAEITRLDMIADSIGADLGDSVLLKLDLQGFELNALIGAGEYLQKIKVVEIEMQLWPLYDGAPDYRAVLEYLLQNGFLLWAVFPHGPHPITGRMSEIDAFFINTKYI